MSSKSVDKGVLDIDDRDDIFEEFFSLNDLVISFSEIFGSERPQHIYSGNEKIPFKKRHPIYQAIFKKEFAKNIKNLMSKK